ncbi:MAG: UDP-N-acetylmuramate dehydrogenase [Lachnospiraceae bacterium]
MNIEAFLSFLETIMTKEDIRRKELMSAHTSFRVGGPAEVFIRVSNRTQLEQIIPRLYRCNLPYFILGKGSNLLVSDQGYEGVVLSLGEEFKKIEVSGQRIRVGAAALLSETAMAALKNSLSGLEFASGIPGSVGGGVVMNAGAYGSELAHVVYGVNAMTETGEILFLSKEELELGYRTSIFKKKPYIVLEVILELQKGKEEEIRSKMRELNQQRRQKQPLEYPSAGSTFKRPEGYFAGKLIMDAGLRGFSIGGAQVSEKHCGFVINQNQATAADIRKLMKAIQSRVKENSGVQLEPEVIFLGYKGEKL